MSGLPSPSIPKYVLIRFSASLSQPIFNRSSKARLFSSPPMLYVLFENSDDV